MKVAKNMDSVFAGCTDDELMFDILFDDDETIIDVLAGVDEAGNLITDGYFDESDEMVGENPDFEYQNDGDAAYSLKDAEGSKSVKPEIGGEVGDGKTVSGREKSAEANAYDTRDAEYAIGLHDKQQLKLEDAAEGPLEDDDLAEREGKTSDLAVETEAYMDNLLNMLEAEDPIEDGKCPVDCDKRAGVDHGVHDTEGKDTEVIGASIKGSVKKDIIADIDDAEQRDGKAENGDTEGVSTHVVGAALEAGDISDDLLAMLEADEEDAKQAAADRQASAKAASNSSSSSSSSSSNDKPEADSDDPGAKDESCKEAFDILSMLEADEEDVDSEDDAPDDSEDEGCCKESYDVSDDLLSMLEAEDPITDGKCPVDSDKRAGCDHGVHDTEGKDTEVIGASIVGGVHSDPIVDIDDAEQRDGKAENKDTEGVKTHVVGAALEASDFVDDLLDSLDDEEDKDVQAISHDRLVPDSIKVNGTDNQDINEAADQLLASLEDDTDDDDIAAIDNEEEGSDPEVEYDYDDDELIDAVINGDINKMVDED